MRTLLTSILFFLAAIALTSCKIAESPKSNSITSTDGTSEDSHSSKKSFLVRSEDGMVSFSAGTTESIQEQFNSIVSESNGDGGENSQISGSSGQSFPEPCFLTMVGPGQVNAQGDGKNYHREAICPANYSALTGTCFCPGGDAGIVASFPVVRSYGLGWECRCSSATTNGALVAAANCMPSRCIPPSYEIAGPSQVNAVGDGRNYHRLATCPAGKRMIGAGFNCQEGSLINAYPAYNGIYVMCPSAVPSGIVGAYAVCL